MAGGHARRRDKLTSCEDEFVENESQRGSPTRGDRQRERTRRKLLDAGRTLIAERGVAGLRIQEITERADVALGSFYNHFTTKEALVEAVISESLTDLAAATMTSVRHVVDPAEVVASSCLRIIRLAFDDPDFARLVVNLGHADSLFGTAMHPYARIAVERGLATGRFAVVDIEVTLTAIIGGAFGLIRGILDGRHGRGAEEAFTQHVLTSLGLTPSDAAAVSGSVAATIGR
jgi:AcrR family transcriptional regulator